MWRAHHDALTDGELDDLVADGDDLTRIGIAHDVWTDRFFEYVSAEDLGPC